MTADINNESSSGLSTRVTLRRTLQLKGDTGNRTIVEDVTQQKYDIVPEKTKTSRHMPLQLFGEKVKPSTSGNYVKCSYEYVVECDVSMGDAIVLRMPVTIYMPQPPPIGGSANAPPAIVVSPQSPVMMLNSPQAMPSPVAVVAVQAAQPQFGQQGQQQFPQQQQQQQPQGGAGFQMQVNVGGGQPEQYGQQQQQQQPQQFGQQPQQQQGGGFQGQMTSGSSSSSTHTEPQLQ